MEFPGGRLDDGESPFVAAHREFGEETGAKLVNFEHVGNWTSPDGAYVGFVVTVPSEDSLEFDPDEHEISGAKWWDTDALCDPTVRDKVTDTLDRITPMLKGWSDTPRNHKGQWTTHQTLQWHGFHLHTDTIVDHYMPMVASAMAQVFSAQTLDQALGAAYGQARKAQPNPSGRGSGLPPNQAAAAATAGAAVGAGAAAGVAGAAAVGAGAVGAGAVGAATAGAATAGAVVGIGAALGILAAARRNTEPLKKVLTRLYGDAYMQGAHTAAQAAHGEMPPWTNAVVLPDGYWEHWTPGVGEEAVGVAGPGLSDLLVEAHHWIKEITDTEVDRIGDAIQQAVHGGGSLAEAKDLVQEIVHDEKRAYLIAETEYARASTLARRQTYRLNNVPYVGWLHQPGACGLCLQNQADSPIPITAQWPNGNVPVHPHCRCVEIPVLHPPARSS